MRVALCVAVVLFTALSGCRLPPPVVSTDYSTRCEIDGSPPGGTLLFATARMPDCDGPALRMTDLRGKKLMFGAVDRSGTIRFYHRDEWFQELAGRLNPKHQLLLFIHGYNNSNEDALASALAIERAIRGNHEVIAFTWPSYHRIPKYFWDETNTAWTQAMSHDLVTELTKRVDKLTIVAHSMGNHLGLNEVTALDPAYRSQHVERLILASPDIDRADFFRTLYQVGIPVTVYGSTRDQALSASWRAHGMPRAGDLAAWVSGHVPDYDMPTVPGVDVVDTSFVTTGWLHHSDYISTREGASDLCRVISGESAELGRRPSGHEGRWILVKGYTDGGSCSESGKAANDWLTGKAKK